MALDSMQEIFERAEAEAIPFWRVVLETDMEERQVTEAHMAIFLRLASTRAAST